MKLRTLLQITVLAGSLSASGWLFADEDEEREGYRSRSDLPAASSAKWKSECSACHLAYPPVFLPERSWQKLMAGLDKHFGQDASVDAATAREITEFLVNHSADRDAGRRGARVARSIPAGAAPLRITETGYFKREHDELNPGVWKRPAVGSPANCAACHKGAEEGDFSERRIQVPR